MQMPSNQTTTLNYFGNRVPSLWNSFPNNISSCTSVNFFRIMLKHSYWLNSYKFSHL